MTNNFRLKMIMKTSDMKLRMQRDLKAERNDLRSSETTMNSTELSIGSRQ